MEPCDEIDLLMNKVSICDRCKSFTERLSSVPGDGYGRAEILFVGRAPGKEENIQGKPFVGQSGRLLDSLIAELGLEREEVWITNLCKCYPEADRANTEDEIMNCMSYLLEEIRLINPKVIVVFGQQPNKALLGIQTNLTAHTETYRDASDRIYVPMVHPASVLKDASGRMQAAWESRKEFLKDLWQRQSELNK